MHEPAIWFAGTGREGGRACYTCERVEEAGSEALGETVRKPVAPEGDSKHAGRIRLDAKRERRVEGRAGDDSALSALAVMESFDEEGPFLQDNQFSRGICRAESDRAFSSSGQFAPGQ